MRVAIPLSIRLATIAGTDIRLHASWAIMVLFFALQRPHYMALYVALSAIVLIHEFGHVLAARQCGYDAPTVTLYVIGGVARIAPVQNPMHELLVTGCGPLVNVAIAPFLFLGGLSSTFLMELAVLNVVMCIFNLMPAFPLDGGRLLRAALTLGLRDGLKATTLACLTGMLFGMAMILTLYWGQVSLALIGLMIQVAAQHELYRTRHLFEGARQAISDLPGADTMRIVWVEVVNLDP